MTGLTFRTHAHTPSSPVEIDIYGAHRAQGPQGPIIFFNFFSIRSSLQVAHAFLVMLRSQFHPKNGEWTFWGITTLT